MKSTKICDLNNCTGCYACYNICPVNAIELTEDKFGNVYPKIDIEKCIGCNMCRNICPSISNKIEYKFPLKCYAAHSKKGEVNYNSSSGGIAYELGKYIISNKGVYYGVSSFCEKEEIVFERISNIENIKRTQGSKYVHAHIKDTYKKIKVDLEANLDVLFIATPCQISGLKSFLKKDYNNLYTVDIVCHGVPSQKLLKEEIKKDFDHISFREGRKFNLVAKKDNEIVYNKDKFSSNYYYLFLKGSIYRENCYTCKYARNERIADITIGDFWGLEDKEIESKNGTSIVLINTDKGEQLFKNIKSIKYKEENIISGFKNNPQLNYPTKKSNQYELFLKYYNGNFIETCKKIYLKSDYIIIFKGKFKEKIKNNKIVKKVIKKWN